MIDGCCLPLQLLLLLGSAGLQVPELLPERGHGAGIRGTRGTELLQPGGQLCRPLLQAGPLRLLLLLGGRAGVSTGGLSTQGGLTLAPLSIP